MKTGDKYGKLTAIRYSHKNKSHSSYWLFKCECGKEKIIRTDQVKNGSSKSCGCWNVDSHKKHGYFGTPTYKSWIRMKGRCLNPNDDAYSHYGGRGIIVDSKWIKFEGFLEDMGERPEGLTLDRINNDKGYSKDNCRWSSRREQSNNKRNNHRITYKGKTLNITQWANELGLNRNTLYGQINRRHLPIEIAFGYKDIVELV